MLKTIVSTRKNLVIVLGLVTLTVLSFAAPAGAASDGDPGVISSAGPLELIETSPTLNCRVEHALDTASEFYGSTACGTLVAVGGELFGPSDIPAGSSASPRTTFTPVSQTVAEGSGTSTDPFRVVTVVEAGAAGLRLTQTDIYIAGQESFTTNVLLENLGGTALELILYRAGDCYLGNSDFGEGAVGNSSVACVADDGRVEQWIAITPGSSYIEARYNEVWAAVGSQLPFPDTCRCDENIDNGAGLSWSVTVPANGSKTIATALAFAPSVEALDADGDGLLDEWETAGLDLDGDGTVDVDLPAMGATADHADIFIEVDWMERPAWGFLWFRWGGESFAPDERALNDVRDAFAAAPVSNPDGTTGIRAHIDSGPSTIMNPDTGATWGSLSGSNRVAYVESLGTFSGNSYLWAEFNALQTANFDTRRADVFRYAIYGDTYAGSGSSGIARGIPGDSFLVTDGDDGWNGGFSVRQEAGTFMHELGHTLSLRHGGDDNLLYKPNYESIMNYAWQLSGSNGPAGIDYSRQVLAQLDESSLSESAGLATPNGRVRFRCPSRGQVDRASGSNIDWNCNGSIDTSTVTADINNCGSRCPNEAGLTNLTGYDDWVNFAFGGGAVGAFGIGDLDDQAPPPTETVDIEIPVEVLAELGPLGDDGDGTVALVGPTTILDGIPGQLVNVDVSNIGGVTSTYVVGFTGTGTGLDGSQATVQVPAGSTKRVEIAVDANQTSVGVRSVRLVLTGADGLVAAQVDSDIYIVDPTDPGVIADAQDVLDALENGDLDGLDPDVAAATAAAILAAMEDEFELPATGTFSDVLDSNIFFADIEWLAWAEITKGCNPPANDRFCPDGQVTRGQMAAFLVRALDLTDNGGGDLFVDDNESIFAGDIDRLGTAGITKGCNPPANDRFCPDGVVTRQQMAAFLRRALDS